MTTLHFDRLHICTLRNILTYLLNVVYCCTSFCLAPAWSSEVKCNTANVIQNVPAARKYSSTPWWRTARQSLKVSINNDGTSTELTFNSFPNNNKKEWICIDKKWGNARGQNTGFRVDRDEDGSVLLGIRVRRRRWLAISRLTFLYC